MFLKTILGRLVSFSVAIIYILFNTLFDDHFQQFEEVRGSTNRSKFINEVPFGRFWGFIDEEVP